MKNFDEGELGEGLWRVQGKMPWSWSWSWYPLDHYLKNKKELNEEIFNHN